MADGSAGGAGDDIDWAAIQQIWLDPAVSQGEMARRSGISRDRIKRRALREGWPERPAGSPTFRNRASARVASLGHENHAPRDGAGPGGPDPDEPVHLPDELEALFARLEAEPDIDAAHRLEHSVAVRILRTTCLKLMQLERRLGKRKTMSGPDSERHTKEMTAMMTNVEKALDLMSGRRGKRGDSKPERASAADVERLRHEIAARLERIQKQRQA
jgi:hypothetical protein